MDKEKRIVSQTKAGDGRDFGIDIKDFANIGARSVLLSGVLAWVFYDSIFGLLVLPVVSIFVYKSFKSNKNLSLNTKFDLEFKELLLALSDALQSGYSIENAFKDAQENLRLLYGEKGMILNDVNEINAKITMRVPAETAFNEFAQKHPTEEAIGFAGVFSFARRLGGEYVKNLRRTIEKMEDKLELKQDIRAGIAEKQMEFKVMTFMPIGILVYVKLTSGGFLSGLYRNPMGIIVMSICLVVYGVAVVFGKRIVDIKV